MLSILSYFRSYFDPAGDAPFGNHSAGQIARHLHQSLARRGDVQYFGSKERPRGLHADLFLGHFWSFGEFCTRNSFDARVVFYSVSDPVRRRRLLESLAGEFGVPLPESDFPPPSFDHHATMEQSDIVLLVGNRFTLDTFPSRWRPKIRVLNYGVDTSLFDRRIGVPRRNEFCYVATNCGLRKGFMDVLRTWSGIPASESRLHAIGEIDPPWDHLLARYNNGSIHAHGWIDSRDDEYLRILQSCRFAYTPTYEEGQMGTLIEAIYSGCVPITTRAAGLDERVLEHCVLVEPLDIEGQRQAIRSVLAWSEAEYRERQSALLQAARRHQSWESFHAALDAALANLNEHSSELMAADERR